MNSSTQTEENDFSTKSSDFETPCMHFQGFKPFKMFREIRVFKIFKTFRMETRNVVSKVVRLKNFLNMDVSTFRVFTRKIIQSILEQGKNSLKIDVDRCLSKEAPTYHTEKRSSLFFQGILCVIILAQRWHLNENLANTIIFIIHDDLLL